ncbi:uncharacterized protein MONOS_7686 [Monocercomonoides exilis]|uniref:uncharacterized protein n=1 Tax=Monocercomonoides exilis TaxID=2049356 RepID=UPI003559BB43|nr:hypothetical protein MONOS_7686 [Monocercomonoides exilis]|eukprot:MONOS_7686.1-p1 / transcript=MONOS_7686.1 / gene=MONOS_7686 / organism=Monocercomonoides_exilis_PA203 / gene_product=unspecified product / transcript_product=unspecified product / location=Mono_scaffold00269:26258-27277(-) / protein_length=261 / sequence_SO=supercontig / SO=protein_coding / is_pseudo=false
MPLSLQQLLSLRELQMMWGYVVARGRCYIAIAAVEVCGCEVGEIDSKELSEAWLGMEDVVLSQVSIALAVLEEREEVEEGERGGKDGGKGEKKSEKKMDGEFVERNKENQEKLEEVIAPLVVEALGLSGLRFVKEKAEVGVNKQHSVEPEVCSSLSAYCIQQEISRAEEEAADGSLGITFDESSDGAVKDVEQMQMSKNDLAMFEESGIEGSSIDLEKEKEEEEEEKVVGDMKFIFKKNKEQKQKEEIIYEVLEKWTRKL